MAKKYQSGVYLGETRRQRAARMRNFGIIVVLLLLTVIASVVFVSWLLDRAEPVTDYAGEVQRRAGLADVTMQYLSAYRWGDDLLRKLYEAMTKQEDGHE
jgi:hypothetical protein